MTLQAHLEGPARFAAGTPVRLVFVLRNTGATPLQILGWGTPLEPPGFARWAELLRDGRPVPFQGATIKRGDPDAADYLPLAAGAELRTEFSLAPAWDTRPPGRYELRPHLQLHDVAPADAALPRPRSEHRGQALRCAPLRFSVVA